MASRFSHARLAMTRWLALTLAGFALTGCQTGPEPGPAEPAAAVPADFDYDRYRSDRAGSAQDVIYQVDAARSLVRMLVYREGPLARLGHNHVVSTTAVGGFARWPLPGGTDDAVHADLYASVADFVVDDPVLRESAGADFASLPTDKDIDGTRRNMLGSSVLDAGRHAFVRVSAEWIDDTIDTPDNVISHNATIDVAFDVRGVTHTTMMTVRVDRAAGSLRVRGSTELAQSAFGIEPFSVLGGALRVRDVFELHIDIAFVRVEVGQTEGTT